LLSSAIPSNDTQPAAWRNENPPGPRANARRNRLAPSPIFRFRRIALVSSAN
jgi:hypothetical protein